MHPKTHALMMNIFGYALLLIGFPLLIILLVMTLGKNEYGLFLFLLIGVIYLTNFILWKLPIYCEKSGCIGDVGKTKTKITAFGFVLQYQCKSCNSFYEAHIFDPAPRGSLKK